MTRSARTINETLHRRGSPSHGAFSAARCVFASFASSLLGCGALSGISEAANCFLYLPLIHTLVVEQHMWKQHRGEDASFSRCQCHEITGVLAPERETLGYVGTPTCFLLFRRLFLAPRE